MSEETIEYIRIVGKLAELGAEYMKSRRLDATNEALIDTQVSKLKAEHENWDAPVSPSDADNGESQED